ncbi:MAG: MotA/TolQ/ExbB proton channel family protein [Rhodospirillaceae bacterium]|nr:MotA/TolQ/ExbB proton channel family protein [Rhodospirillaceae bacterium]
MFEVIGQFLERGGPVLYVIGLVTFFLWALIVERYLYFWFMHKRVCQKALDEWRARKDHTSWAAHKVRSKLVSDVRLSATAGLILISGAVAMCPLLGLLGTVTGMVEVFDVMAITGSSNPRAMASGVSRSTIPTMSGMVAALSGIYFQIQLKRKAQEEIKHFADQMTLD